MVKLSHSLTHTHTQTHTHTHIHIHIHNNISNSTIYVITNAKACDSYRDENLVNNAKKPNYQYIFNSIDHF